MPWPIGTTAIGRLMRRGDICVRKRGSTSSSAWDGLSLAMIVNHNVEAKRALREDKKRIEDHRAAIELENRKARMAGHRRAAG